MSVSANPIPPRTIGFIYSYVLRGKAKEAVLQLYERPLSRSFRKVSESSWRNEKHKQMLRARRILVFA